MIEIKQTNKQKRRLKQPIKQNTNKIDNVIVKNYDFASDEMLVHFSLHLKSLDCFRRDV